MNAPLLLGLSLAIGAPALKEKEKTPSIVGEWAIENYTAGGAGGSSLNRWVFRSDGSRSIFGPTGEELASGQYTSDAKAGTLDMGAGQRSGEYLCLFKVEGDTLTLNVGWERAPRPTAFESPPGSQCTLYVMKRVKVKE